MLDHPSATSATDTPRLADPSGTPATPPEESGGFSWKYWAFRAAGGAATVVPFWLARPLMVAGGWAAWALVRPLRRRADWNLRHIPALAADPSARRRATRQAFVTLALNYLDFFRGRHVTWEELGRGWVIDGWDEFERAMALGKGSIVISAHYGPFEYAAWKLGELGHPMVTPAERLKPERLHQLVSAMRNHHGARMAAGDDRETLRALIAGLRSGSLVLFAVDRWIMGPSSPWPFFGTPAQLPLAPFALAARSDAPVFLLASRRAGRGHFTGVVESLTPERVDPTAAAGEGSRGERGEDREAAIARIRTRAYAAIERMIAEDPGQWVSALSTVWAEPDPATRD